MCDRKLQPTTKLRRQGWRRVTFLGGAVTVALVAGCVGDRPGGDDALSRLLEPSPPEVSPEASPGRDGADAQSVNDAAMKYAQQLSEAVHRQGDDDEAGLQASASGSEQARNPSEPIGGGVRSQDPGRSQRDEGSGEGEQAAGGGVGAMLERWAEAVGRGWRKSGEGGPDSPGTVAAGATEIDARNKAEKASLVAKLEAVIRAGKQRELRKAVELAGLKVAAGLPIREVSGNSEMSGGVKGSDVQGLDSLVESDQKTVDAYGRLISVLGERVGQGQGGRLDWQRLEEVAGVSSGEGQRLIRVRQVALCRRVEGYGVYDAFEQAVFLSGRSQPVVVYTELDDFTAKGVGGARGDEYEVRLTQEVALYNEADGLLVWQEPKYEVVDRSRNRRRDFFVVQMAQLPAGLGAGKYVLKVRVTDVLGQCSDEKSVTVRLVADTKLTQLSKGF